MEIIQIKNEVVNFLNSGAAIDFFYKKGTKSDTEFDFLDSPLVSLEVITVTVLYQNNGETLKEYTIAQAAAPSFIWVIDPADFEDAKLLNYYVQAVNQDKELLFYGAFTIN